MNKRYQVRPELVILRQAICDEYQVTVEAFKSACRRHILVCARRAFCTQAYNSMLYSCTEIGIACARDHTTVLYHAGVVNKPWRQILGRVA